jgi:DNA-binding MarR family transcriptional regulator
MLDRLESSGYIKRVPSAEDRRKILIQRTEKDRSFQHLYVRVSKEMTELFFGDFSKREMDEFEAYLRRIYDNLTRREGRTE